MRARSCSSGAWMDRREGVFTCLDKFGTEAFRRYTRTYLVSSLSSLQAEAAHLSAGDEEPHYGRPRKPDPYAKLKQSRRYV